MIKFIKSVFGKSEQMSATAYSTFITSLTRTIEEATELLSNVAGVRGVYGAERTKMVKKARATGGALIKHLDTLLGVGSRGQKLPATAYADIIDVSILCKVVVDRATTLLAACACFGTQAVATAETQSVLADLKSCQNRMIEFLSE